MLAAMLLLCLALPGLAQSSRPFPGVIALHVDVSDVQRRVFRVVETIPAGPAVSSCTTRSGCPATTRRAAPSSSSRDCAFASMGAN